MNALLSWLIEGIFLACAATLALRLVPKASPAARYLFCWVALALTLTLPLFPEVFAGTASNPLAIRLAGDAAAASRSVRFDAQLLGREPLPAPFDSTTVALMTLPAPSPAVASAVVTMWSAVTAFLLLRLLLGIRAVRRLASTARPVDPSREQQMPLWLASKGSKRPASLCESDRLDGACAIGFFQPRIVVSSRLVATLSPQALEAIVLHEQAHIWRYDDWTRLLQQLVIACAGCHPALRWICRQIDRERESACDRHVVRRLGTPTVYVRALADAAAAGLKTPWRFAAAPAVLTTRAALRSRVERLLDTTPIVAWQLWTGSAAGLACVALAASAATTAPPLVVLDTTLPPTGVPLASLAAPASTPAGFVGLQVQPLSNVALQRDAVANPVEATADRKTTTPAPAESDSASKSTTGPGARGATARQLSVALARTSPTRPFVTPGTGTSSRETESISREQAAHIRAAGKPAALDEPHTDATPPSAAVLNASPFTVSAFTVSTIAADPVVARAQARAQSFVDAGTGMVSFGSATGGAATRVGIATGDAVSHAGVTAGDAASRAGRSIGRFFSRGGASLAKRVSSTVGGR